MATMAQLPSPQLLRPLVELADAGGRVLIVLDFVGAGGAGGAGGAADPDAPRLALFGERVPRGMLDLLPGS